MIEEGKTYVTKGGLSVGPMRLVSKPCKLPLKDFGCDGIYQVWSEGGFVQRQIEGWTTHQIEFDEEEVRGVGVIVVTDIKTRLMTQDAQSVPGALRWNNGVLQQEWSYNTYDIHHGTPTRHSSWRDVPNVNSDQEGSG